MASCLKRQLAVQDSLVAQLMSCQLHGSACQLQLPLHMLFCGCKHSIAAGLRSDQPCTGWLLTRFSMARCRNVRPLQSYHAMY